MDIDTCGENLIECSRFERDVIMKKCWIMFVCVAAASAWADTAYFTTVDGYQHSSWTNAYNWARGSLDGERIGNKGAPLPEDMDYFIPADTVLRTPMQGTRTFPGRSLTVGTAGTSDWSSLTLSLSGNDHQTVAFPKLVLASGLLAEGH